MIVLGIDTSTNYGSVAITDKYNLLSESSIPSSNSYSKSLIGTIDELLKKCRIGIGDIDGYAVSIGPGSFTGLRIGLSTCKGFHLASGRPIIPVDTLDAMVESILNNLNSHDPLMWVPRILNSQLLCPVLDARKGEIYTALYKYEDGKAEKIADEMAVTPEKHCQGIDRPAVFFGDGLRTYGDFIKSRLKGLAFFYDDMPKTIASSIAFMGAKKLERGDVADSGALKPKYIRRSEAEIKFGNR
ncbi:MAG: tRNA (adenosine(37)-N6)-threonylcarbamoyltransferase complex dimerization subunit type 1 TsaB [Nitrospinae bacterium]|nr:tRNA (adenosine(37)-N6)-threonylcarbamoyltransferase complex dimerization subunit type 1 TsaB [Nitrospinota bacterium]